MPHPLKQKIDMILSNWEIQIQASGKILNYKVGKMHV